MQHQDLGVPARCARWQDGRRFAVSCCGELRPAPTRRSPRRNHGRRSSVFAILFLLVAVPPLHGREHKKKVASEDYGLGFSTEIASPESEVVKAVEAVVNNGIIQGSKEYNKDKYIENASAAASSPLFPEWKEPGKVYYKVRTGVLAPLNFKDSKDEGTLAVRYVVQSKDASKTILRIDAVFVEDFRRTVHPSDGSVENAECQEIQNQIDAVEAEKKQSEEREKQRQEKLAGQELERKRVQEETSALAAAQTSAQTLDQHLDVLAPPGGARGQGPRGSTEIRPLPQRNQCEISGRRRRSRNPDRDSILVRRGNHRWTTRLD